VALPPLARRQRAGGDPRERAARALLGYPTNRYKLVGVRAVGAITGLAGMLLLFRTA
jgi:ABC-type branched-subunit amino acid transport system permease subunit